MTKEEKSRWEREAREMAKKAKKYLSQNNASLLYVTNSHLRSKR